MYTPNVCDFCDGSVHDEATAKEESVEVGKGVLDIVGVLKALLSLKYQYPLALEDEANADAPMPGIMGSLGYQRGALALME